MSCTLFSHDLLARCSLLVVWLPFVPVRAYIGGVMFISRLGRLFLGLDVGRDSSDLCYSERLVVTLGLSLGERLMSIQVRHSGRITRRATRV